LLFLEMRCKMVGRCYFDTFDGANPRFESELRAPLSINPEHTSGFNPRSRRVDSPYVDAPGRGKKKLACPVPCEVQGLR